MRSAGGRPIRPSDTAPAPTPERVRDRRYPYRSATAALAVLFAAALAGCGGDSEGDGVAKADTGASSSAESTTEPAEADRDQALLDFSRCMREDGGVPDFPDPEPDENGDLQLTPPTGGDLDQEALRDGLAECQSYLEGAVNFSEEQQTELRDAQLKFAQCLRDEGIDVDDPDPNQLGPGNFGDLDQDDPKVQDALEVCGPIFQEALQDAQEGTQ
ncbi:MAG: hypothetical protein ACRCYQ_13665 [Nocardioides sp.]